MSLWTRIRDALAPAPVRKRRRRKRRGLVERIVDAIRQAPEREAPERERPRRAPRTQYQYEPEPDYEPDDERGAVEPDSIEGALIALGIDADIADFHAPIIRDVLGPYV